MQLKSRREIELIRRAGLVVWEAHQLMSQLLKPGVTTGELDAAVEEFYKTRGAMPLFKGVDTGGTPYPSVTCISVNEEVVHGIPGRRRINEGDIVSIDTACRLEGWCADAACTYGVGTIDTDSKRLLDITEATLKLAIDAMGRCIYWSQVATEMAAFVRDAGFSVVEEFVGHAIGREMWERPQVPNFWTKKHRPWDFKLRPGLVLAVEPMVNSGARNVLLLDDEWTVVAADRKRCAHFEHTIAITEEGPKVMTLGPDGQGWAI